MLSSGLVKVAEPLPASTTGRGRAVAAIALHEGQAVGFGDVLRAVVGRADRPDVGERNRNRFSARHDGEALRGSGKTKLEGQVFSAIPLLSTWISYSACGSS